jgi:predicted dehydrogenase
VSALRAVVVGAGGMGRAWASTIVSRPDVSLVGWVDLFTDRVAEGIEAAGLKDVSVEEDIEAALSKLSPDFVVDVAVPEAHFDVTRQCLERNVPVLGEKPMAATLEEARDLVRLSERTSTLFVVSQNRRYNAGLAGFKNLVEQRLGGVGQLNAEFYRAPRFGGFRDEMDSPLLLDMAIHTFDAARYLAGSAPVSALCTEFNPSWSWYRGAASAVAEFEFRDGLRFSYEGSWCASGLETSWESSWRAIGAFGTALWDGTNNAMAEVRKGGDDGGELERVEAPPVTISGPGIAGSLADFVRAVRTGEIPMNECHDNIKSFAMVIAALESSRTGRTAPVET